MYDGIDLIAGSADTRQMAGGLEIALVHYVRSDFKRLALSGSAGAVGYGDVTGIQVDETRNDTGL